MDPSIAKLDQFISHIANFSGDPKLSLIFRGLPPGMKQGKFKEWLLPMRLKTVEMVGEEKESFAIVTFNRAPDVRRALQRTGQFVGGSKVSHHTLYIGVIWVPVEAYHRGRVVW